MLRAVVLAEEDKANPSGRSERPNDGNRRVVSDDVVLPQLAAAGAIQFQKE